MWPDHTRIPNGLHPVAFPKSGLPATYANSGTGTEASVSISAKAEGLKETFTGPAGCLVHGSGESGALIVKEGWKVNASQGGVATGVHVSDTFGLYLAGESSAEKAKQPRLEAEKYPAAISGSQSATSLPKWKMVGSTAQCGEAQFKGEALGATAELSVTPTYGKCVDGTLPAQIKMHGCHLVYHLLNLGPPYAGSMDIACASESEAIEVAIYTSNKKLEEDSPICIAAYGPQAGLTGVSLANTGSGFERAVTASTSLSGLKYTYTKISSFLCPSGAAGTYTDGTYSSGTTLRGTF